MTTHPFVVSIQVHTGGYEKRIELVGEACNGAEAITSALAAESHNELEEYPHRADTYIDDIFTYVVDGAQQVSYDEYLILKQHLGAF